MSETSLSLEYSKSNRATCKGCKDKIEKSEIRVGTKSSGQGDYDMVSWRHLNCFKITKKWKDVDPEKIEGFFDLEDGDKDKVKDYFLGGGIKKSEKKNINKSEDGDDEEEQKKPGSGRKQASQIKLDPNEIKGYDDDQIKIYYTQLTELQKKNISQLKDMLRINDQKVSGTKQELVERVADGITLGQLPKCTSCTGGRLKFDFKKGTYKCPGYMDDDHYVNCGKKFALDEVQRAPWISEE